MTNTISIVTDNAYSYVALDNYIISDPIDTDRADTIKADLQHYIDTYYNGYMTTDNIFSDFYDNDWDNVITTDDMYLI